MDVATGRVAEIKSLWPGHGVTNQYFELGEGMFQLSKSEFPE